MIKVWNHNKWSKEKFVKAAIVELMEEPKWVTMKRAQGRQEGMDTPSSTKHIRLEHLSHTFQKVPKGHKNNSYFTFPKALQQYQKYQCSNKCKREIRTCCSCDKNNILC